MEFVEHASHLQSYFAVTSDIRLICFANRLENALTGFVHPILQTVSVTIRRSSASSLSCTPSATQLFGTRVRAYQVFAVLSSTIAVLELASICPLIRTRIQLITPSERSSTILPPVLVVRPHNVLLPVFHDRIADAELKRGVDDLARLRERGGEVNEFLVGVVVPRTCGSDDNEGKGEECRADETHIDCEIMRC